MDWDSRTWDHKPASRPEPPAPELLEECWRVRGPSQAPILCGIYRDAAPGVDVRCGYSLEHLIRSERCPSMDVARALADRWLTAAIEKGFARA